MTNEMEVLAVGNLGSCINNIIRSSSRLKFNLSHFSDFRNAKMHVESLLRINKKRNSDYFSPHQLVIIDSKTAHNVMREMISPYMFSCSSEAIIVGEKPKIPLKKYGRLGMPPLRLSYTDASDYRKMSDAIKFSLLTSDFNSVKNVGFVGFSSQEISYMVNVFKSKGYDIHYIPFERRVSQEYDVLNAVKKISQRERSRDLFSSRDLLIFDSRMEEDEFFLGGIGQVSCQEDIARILEESGLLFETRQTRMFIDTWGPESAHYSNDFLQGHAVMGNDKQMCNFDNLGYEISDLVEISERKRSAMTGIRPDPVNGNKVFMIRGKSGSRKSSAASLAEERIPDFNDNFYIVKTHTTRPHRGDKEDKKVISSEEFRKMSEKGEYIIEYEYNGNMYGIPKECLEQYNAGKNIIILQTTMQGYESCVKYFDRENIPLHMILFSDSNDCSPEDDLRKRGTETEEEIQKRLDDSNEYSSYGDFKQIIYRNMPIFWRNGNFFLSDNVCVDQISIAHERRTEEFVDLLMYNLRLGEQIKKARLTSAVNRKVMAEYES